MSSGFSIMTNLAVVMGVVSNINQVSSVSLRWVSRAEAFEGLTMDERAQQRLLVVMVKAGWLDCDYSNPRGYKVSKLTKDYIKNELSKINRSK